MSVLLDALKKAAAEKKKAMDSSVDSEMVLSESNKAPDEIVPPALKLSTEESEPVTSIDEPSSSAAEEDVKTETALKFTLSDMSTPMSNQDDLDSAISEPSISLESPDLVSDNIQHASEESAQLLEQDQPKDIDSSVTQDELSQDLFQVTPSVLSDSETQQSLDSGDSNLFEADKDSFEWSINALPGYSTASMDDSAPIEKNSILLTGALTSEPKAKKKSHSKWLLVLIVMLMFIGISVYGLIYYQEQSEQLENSMRKYELAKMQISLPKKKLPIATEIDSSLQKSEESSNERGSTSMVVSTEVVQASKVPSTSIEENDIAVPLTQNEPTASVVKVSNSDNKAKTRERSTYKKPVASTAKPVYQPILVQVNKTEATLADAYNAYEMGHLELSHHKFREVLSFDPKNITAMIGLGGVAASSGQHYVAMDYYQQALNIEPNSLEIYEAIANLSPNIELNSEWYDSLKNMVTTYPSSAGLQFALGNLYSSNNDWLAAQESYFNAYALEMNNPDFTVNLAISLDRLGKYPLAAQYYTQALALAGSNRVNFNASDIKNRLISIRQFMDQGK